MGRPGEAGRMREAMMRVLRLANLSSNPLVREEELFRKLQTAGVSSPERLRLTIDGRYLFVDGFVSSVGEKLRVEKACRQVAPESYLVNRLRVAVADEPMMALADRVHVPMLTTTRCLIPPDTEFVWQHHRRYCNTTSRPIRRSAGHGTS
jgi:hypothetical protein